MVPHWVPALAGAVVLVAACSSDSPTTPNPDPDPVVADLTLDADRDNTLFEESDTLSNGAGQFLFTGMTRDTISRRALVRFDLANAGIPQGATVDSVQLVLRMDRTIVGDFAVDIHRVTADWGEAGSDAPNAEGIGTRAEAGDATWRHRFSPDQLWTTPGGDFDPTPSATQLVGLEVRTYTWGPSSRLLDDVSGWITAPASNFGWIIIGDETTHTTAKRFGSREDGVAGNRPKLRIFYTS